ncbi:MAG: glycine--tRNA ligase, partial [Bacteroidota bacterium]|nr:glycine--tRNA ligase [Bacteroidota bacterium]
MEDSFKKIISHSKEYGFVFQNSEIYDGLSAVYDYGQNGVILKNNLKEYWWKSMVQLHQNIVGIDSAIFVHPKTWKASGHIDGFSDPLIDNKDSKKRYRADVLIEDYIEQKIEKKIRKEIEKAQKRFGDVFDVNQFTKTNPNILRYLNKKNEIESMLSKALEAEDFESLKQLIVDLGIVCPISGSKNWTDIKQFNLMYSTQMSATQNDENLYLRPETAQGIFLNYLNVQ